MKVGRNETRTRNRREGKRRDQDKRGKDGKKTWGGGPEVITEKQETKPGMNPHANSGGKEMASPLVVLGSGRFRERQVFPTPCRKGHTSRGKNDRECAELSQNPKGVQQQKDWRPTVGKKKKKGRSATYLKPLKSLCWRVRTILWYKEGQREDGRGYGGQP